MHVSNHTASEAAFHPQEPYVGSNLKIVGPINNLVKVNIIF